MAKKQINGQLDLFSYINQIQNAEPYGDMQMVSLMPMDEEPDAESNEIDEVDNKILDDKSLVMSKYFTDNCGNSAYVEYRNYNRVIIQLPGKKKEEFVCENSSEAVDMYINKMYDLMDDKSLSEV